MRRFVAALVVFASLFALSGVKAQTTTPTITPEPCSLDVKADAANITFVNYTSRPVSLFWVDFACKEEAYATINAGDSYNQPTFVGHIWNIRDQETNELIATFAAKNSTPITFPIGAFAPLPDKPACSPTTKTDAVTLTFVNYTSLPVALYWIDFDCKEQFYQTLNPGQSYDQQTFVQHSWLIRDDDNKTDLVEFAAANSTNTIVPIGANSVTPGTACSSNSSTALNRSLVNYTSRQVDVFWVDQNCNEKFYQTLDAGGTFKTQTYDGHIFRLYDHENKLLINETTFTAESPATLGVGAG